MKNNINASPSRTTALAIAIVAFLITTVPAHAAGGGGAANLESFFQAVLDILTGTPARLAGAIAIAVAGWMTLFRGMDAGIFYRVVFGIFLIFSSAWIVDQIVT